MRILGRIPFHPMLFAAYAVLFLYATNLNEVLPVDAEAPLGRAILGAAIAIAVCSLLLRSLRRGAIVASALVIAFYAYGHISPAMSSFGADGRLQLAGWAAPRRRGAHVRDPGARLAALVTGALNVAALVLVLLASSTIVPYEANRASRAPLMGGPSVARSTSAAPIGPKRDIYFLIFDSYGSAEALQRRFEITDNDIYDWLRQHGFQVPAHAHTNYRATDFALAATLTWSTSTASRRPSARCPGTARRRRRCSRTTRSRGVPRVAGLHLLPARFLVPADPERPDRDREHRARVHERVRVGAQRHDDLAGDPEGARADGHPAIRSVTITGHVSLPEFRELERISTAPGPKFVFAHFLLPHDPYVFRADGSPLPEAEANSTPEAQLYANHIAFANSQIKRIVGYLPTGSDATRPIILIDSDEGPLNCQNVDCVTNTPDYLRIRLGNLIAMDLPGVTEQLPDDYTLVNTFRTVFRDYFGADLRDLPNRTFTWPNNNHIYDFEDVTREVTGPSP